MEFIFIIILTIIFYLAVWLNEFKRCMKEQIKHNDFWEKHGEKPFVDFCKHL